MVETTQFGLDGLTDEALKARIVLLTKELKSYTKGTLVNKWEAGKRLTDKQVAYLKANNRVDETELKTIVVKVPVVDIETGEFVGFKNVNKSFNKLQHRIDAAISADVLTDEASVMSNNRRLEDNSADLEVKMENISQQRAELAAAKAVFHVREEKRIAKEMEAKGHEFMSRKAIYEKAVADSKLKTEHVKEHTAEITVSA